MRTGRGRAGFTLIELLVVVSIIALLIAILLPSLKNAREQAKSGACLSNLRGIANAGHVYAADDRGENGVPAQWTFIKNDNTPGQQRRDIIRMCYGGKSGRGPESGGGQGTVGSSTFWGTGSRRGPGTRPMNSVMVKGGFEDYHSNPGQNFKNWKNDERLNMGQYQCPSDVGYRGLNRPSWADSRLSSYDHYGTSYSANSAWIFDGGGCISDAQLGNDCCMSNAPALRPLSRVPNPANTLFYQENCGYFAWVAEPEGETKEDCNNRFAFTPDANIRGWHGRDWFFNNSFADGHGATIKMRGYRSPRLSEYPDGNADLEQAYQRWCQVINRGEGWQIDTLPSPPIRTDVPCATAAGGGG